ncbi:aminotransferase class I/II-fold pyridoxal phosphate-dependent enzyme [Alkalihalobacillus sp. LMS6]|uniref:aminotransferase class I/II-fold pyridoxal phosphate-dependent enzyme n=1 Tax=Alkalihalobacillus sp. LMS6 TaxID=2924034 RepID=UPI0020D07123|nr:aminotransferase class I/II-fold pyridoxal phosphate-dependent enzyme [Alkalihalobacillus sp. LMS6]UTR06523.1 aminotransferase class I/II-fold pyridoxal phosphate-dependent enzyme [Alkalihalobacillus sp. LMS6]
MSVRTPIIDAIETHIENEPISFHVPGHKNGVQWHTLLPAFKKILPYDLTEISGLDDLHDPKEAIAESQALCARFYGAGETSYLIGGSTSGNLAMIYGTLQEGDVVLVERDCHKSVMHALELCKAQVVFLSSIRSSLTSHPLGLSCSTLEDALVKYPLAKALIVTYPNYWGHINEYEPLFSYAKRKGLYILVDEAHGPHFPLGDHIDGCPPPALRIGADIVVQSAHKMLPALTMTGWLHFSQSIDPIVKKRVKHALQMFQSSSPSYILLASLDGARAFLEQSGKQSFEEAMHERDQLCEWIDQHGYLERVADESSCADPLKIMIRATNGEAGNVLLAALNKVGIYAEMADPHMVLIVLGLGKLHPNTHERLKKVTIEREMKRKNVFFQAGAQGTVSELIRTTKNDEEAEMRSLHEAIGSVSASDVIPYPPGVPLLLKGERITSEHVEQLNQYVYTGVSFQGFQPKEGLLVKGKAGEE